MQYDPIATVSKLSGSGVRFSKHLSLFDPYLNYFVEEMLKIGGDAVVSMDRDGNITGLYTYDTAEKVATVFTPYSEVFNYFLGYRPHDVMFSEIRTELNNEPYSIYSINIGSYEQSGKFSHEVRIADEGDIDAIEKFMKTANPKMNMRWVRVAIESGDECFIVELGDGIAGLGWLSLVNGSGRLHSLYVYPHFRKQGMGADLLRARLMWLKAKRAKSAFSEISDSNTPSSAIAEREGMTKVGKIYQYFGKQHG
jgi:ribosomal-protein-alanine N-acetyltransferase